MCAVPPAGCAAMDCPGPSVRNGATAPLSLDRCGAFLPGPDSGQFVRCPDLSAAHSSRSAAPPVRRPISAPPLTPPSYTAAGGNGSQLSRDALATSLRTALGEPLMARAGPGRISDVDDALCGRLETAISHYFSRNETPSLGPGLVGLHRLPDSPPRAVCLLMFAPIAP